MRDEDIHIGDMVRVRQWYDLANEYGENCHLVEGLFEPSNKAYDIPIHAKRTWFTAHMEKFCGNVFTVSEAYLSGGVSIGYKFQDDNDTGINRWFICAEMLEAVDEDNEWEIADDNDIESLLLT